MTDIKGKIEQSSLSGSVSSAAISASSVYGRQNEYIQDYFLWREDRFDPFFHATLNDPVGSTTIIALSGPDGSIMGSASPGVGPSMVRPYDKYSSVLLDDDDGVNDIQFGDENTFNFIHGTWNFSIAFWMIRGEGGRLWALSTYAATSVGAGGGFTWEIFDDRLNFRMKSLNPEGNAEQEIATVSGLEFTTGEIYHVCATGDGEWCYIYVNGVMVGRETVPTQFDGSSPQNLKLGGFYRWTGNFQGVLIDDEFWDADDVLADYQRGQAIFYPDESPSGDFSVVSQFTEKLAYQMRYPTYEGQHYFWTDSLANSPAFTGDKIQAMTPLIGENSFIQPLSANSPAITSRGLFFDGENSLYQDDLDNEIQFIHQVCEGSLVFKGGLAGVAPSVGGHGIMGNSISNTVGFLFRFTASGDFQFAINDGAGFVSAISSYVEDDFTDTLRTYVCTFTPSSVRFYVDGVFIDEVEVSFRPTTDVSTGNMSIGAIANSSSTLYNGTMTYFGASENVLTDTEIQQMSESLNNI